MQKVNFIFWAYIALGVKKLYFFHFRLSMDRFVNTFSLSRMDINYDHEYLVYAIDVFDYNRRINYIAG